MGPIYHMGQVRTGVSPAPGLSDTPDLRGHTLSQIHTHTWVDGKTHFAERKESIPRF